MFRLLQNLSLQRKLMVIIMLTSSIALLVACAAFVLYDLRLVKRSMVRDLSTLAKVVGQMNNGNITFGDSNEATESLQYLRERPNIVAAALFNEDGKIVGKYLRTGMPSAHSLPERRPDGAAFNGSFLEVFQDVTLTGERIGTIFIQTDLTELNSRIQQYATILTFVLLASSGIALVLSSGLQRIVSRPILTLAQTARAISREKNYSTRAQKFGSDELGELTDAFNEMLNQIQQRDAALQAPATPWKSALKNARRNCDRK
jgi:HAMP domain-containing protein